MHPALIPCTAGMVLGDGVDDGVAENIPCAQGWSAAEDAGEAEAIEYSLCAGMVLVESGRESGNRSKG